CADVSDGLIADVGHIAQASGVGVVLDLEKTPLSAPATVWFDGRVDPEAALVTLATGGDDYELVLTAPRRAEAALRAAAEARHLRLTHIGEVVRGKGVKATYLRQPVDIRKGGWTHD